MKTNTAPRDNIRDYVNWLFTYPGTPWPGNGQIMHTYWLRADVRIQIQLPADLRAPEATRITAMLKTLPFNDAKGLQ